MGSVYSYTCVLLDEFLLTTTCNSGITIALNARVHSMYIVNPEDLRREIELLLGVAAYSLLPWRRGATLFCFTRRKCWRDDVIYNYYK